MRRVFVRAGYAYVPHTDLVSIVSTRVRTHLSKQLSVHKRMWPALKEEESERLTAFLATLAEQCAPRAPPPSPTPPPAQSDLPHSHSLREAEAWGVRGGAAPRRRPSFRGRHVIGDDYSETNLLLTSY